MWVVVLCSWFEGDWGVEGGGGRGGQSRLNFFFKEKRTVWLFLH
jgi:hypothetical protein